jgi:hypothetical protein
MAQVSEGAIAMTTGTKLTLEQFWALLRRIINLTRASRS